MELESTSALARAQELRASLGARRDLDALLAEVARLREESAEEAEALLCEAQKISDDLLAESHAAAQLTTEVASQQADAIVDHARAEAAAMTQRALSELDAAQQQVEALHRELAAATAVVGDILSGLHGGAEPEPSRGATGATDGTAAATGPAPAEPEPVVPEPAAVAEVPQAEVPQAEVSKAQVSSADLPVSALAGLPVASLSQVAEAEIDSDRAAAPRPHVLTAVHREPRGHHVEDLDAVDDVDEIDADDVATGPEAEPEPVARPLGWLFRSAQ